MMNLLSIFGDDNEVCGMYGCMDVRMGRCTGVWVSGVWVHHTAKCLV